MAGNDIKGKVKALYEIMKDEKIQELEVNSKDYTLFIKRKDPNEGEKQFIVKKTPTAPAQTQSIVEQMQKEIDKETVKSPITGVFYQSPSPSSPVFVNVGDIVEIGEPLCIIEAMKVMNEVKATFKAKILKVLVENATSVNSAQDLFEIKKV